MRNATVICYLLSFLSFGLEYSKMLLVERTVIEHAATYDYTGDLSLATSFFVSAIFFAAIGLAFFIVMIKEQKKWLKDSIPLKTQGVYRYSYRYDITRQEERKWPKYL